MPTREQYLALKTSANSVEPLAPSTPSTHYYTTVKRPKRIAPLRATGREARKLAREQARIARLSPAQRAWEDSIREAVTKTVETYAGDNKS